MTFPKDTHVSVTHQGWHFTAVVQDSRVQGRARGVIVADPGTSPFEPGRFVSVPVRCLTVRPADDEMADAEIAAAILGEYMADWDPADVAHALSDLEEVRVYRSSGERGRS